MEVKKKIAVWCALFALLVALVPPGSAKAESVVPFKQWCEDNGFKFNDTGLSGYEHNLTERWSEDDFVIVIHDKNVDNYLFWMFDYEAVGDIVEPIVYNFNGVTGRPALTFRNMGNEPEDIELDYFSGSYVFDAEKFVYGTGWTCDDLIMTFVWNGVRSQWGGRYCLFDTETEYWEIVYSNKDVYHINGTLFYGKNTAPEPTVVPTPTIAPIEKTDVGDALAPILQFISNFLDCSFVAFGYEVSVASIILYSAFAGLIIAVLKEI